MNQSTRYHATAAVKDVSESPRACLRAVVTVTWSGGESVVYTDEDREPVTDAPADVLAVARAALDLLPVEAWEGDSAEGVFEVIDDPFARQIYAVKRWTRDEDTGQSVQVMAIQVGIDGFRAISEATGDYCGQEGPFWCGEDGEWKDVWLSEKPPRAAKVLVRKKGVDEPYVGVATYKSYVQMNKDGNPRATWASMPDVMLGKCAEAQALRKAFPKQLSGVHADDELGEGDAEPVPLYEHEDGERDLGGEG